MTYWQDINYKEQFVVPFDDVEGNQWKISIQSPNYSGIVRRLTGADTPIQWEGVGNDKQEDVMCGSTGTLTVVCLEGQEGIFTTGNLLPMNINDRRVQVFRFNSTASVWTLVWQGFIKPDLFSQDWDRTPYKIEIPIVSIVSALEFFELPPESDTETYSLFSQQTSIAGLIRAIFIASGCDIRTILTNKPIYEDFNGATHQIPIPGSDPVQYYDAHWTQGTAYSEYFYKFESGRRVAKSFKDVMETICYPYGKIHDYAYTIAIVMSWKNDADDYARLYGLNVWQNYENRVISETVRFTDYGELPQIMLSEIQTEDTDNTLSIIPGPCRVKFSREPETEKTIFEFSDKFIKPNLPIIYTLPNDKTSEWETKDDEEQYAGNRYLYAINKNFVNYEEFCKNLESVSIPSALSDYCFCRVVEVTPSGGEGGVDSTNNTTAVTVPLGLCFNANVLGGEWKETNIALTIKNGVKTTENANVIKLSFKPYRMELKNPNVGRSGDDVYAEFIVYDITSKLWLSVDTQTLATSWAGQEQRISYDFCFNESNEWLIYFNEHRPPGDRRLHYIRINMIVKARTATDEYAYGRMFATFKMEYSSLPQATLQSIPAKIFDSLNKNGVIEECNGSGEEIEIEFKTLCAYSYLHVDSVLLPSNSFCNARTYIDKQPRKQIEIECAKFDRNAGFDLVSTYSVVKDEQTVYVPVAVGLNPRFCQMKLVLISTNVE